MVDINKYLENQLALAKQKCDEIQKRKDPISQKSKTAAEFISKKQDQNFLKKCPKETHKYEIKQRLYRPSTSSDSLDKHSDEDSEYLPSSDEGDPEIKVLSTTSTSRIKNNLKKIVDDGDSNLYNERVEKWKKDLMAACSGTYEGNAYTADIQYVLEGNENSEEIHELQNGLCIPKYMWTQLYKFQRTGVKWLWELHQIKSGGLLGDEMGLGKTVQVIAFLTGLSKTDSGSWGGLGPSIIVAPATVIYQWVLHFHYWCPQLRVSVLHHSGSHIGNHNKLIKDMHASHGILLVTYAGIVKYNKDLMSKQWHYIILDEGHKIRNPDTQVSKLIKKFQTPHRILITGSPMQNSLQELWSLFDFMSPGLLGTYSVFMDHFAQPITQGGYANATEYQEATALEIAKALKNIITPYMLRRTKAEVQEYIKLPEKNEQVLFCTLSQEQRDLYMGYLMSGTVRSILDKESKFGDPVRARILVALSTLRKICNHPDLYLYEAQEENQQIDEDKFGFWKRSGKLSVVHSLLKIWQKQGHRALIFSQSRAMLCILELHLQNQEYKYLKMDGTVSVGQRQNLIQTFNENPEYLVFLATTRVGGLGVNLTGADRVIIYDPDWNPATDSQAKERAWRIGQERNVTVYRLLSAGTIEEKIYQRQIFKHLLSNRILIDPNQKNILTTSTLQGLFTLEELNREGDTETAFLFKHTKVNIDNKTKEKGDHTHVSNGSLSRKKLEDMKRLAREISRKISTDAKKTEVNEESDEDPREKYKKKREQLLNPSRIVEPEINLIDGKITNVPFENVMCELDIINMHVKADYEKNLIEETLKNQNTTDVECTLSIKDNNETHRKEMQHEVINSSEIFKDLSFKPQKISQKNMPDGKEDNFLEDTKKRYKRKLPADLEIDSLISVKKVKKHKEKKYEDDDDYVLSKLFAKAGVKNALQHDVVIGLAEKEKRHRMKEEAMKKAKDAVRAIRHSTK